MNKVTSYFVVATDDPWMKNEGVGVIQNLFLTVIIAALNVETQKEAGYYLGYF